VPKDHGVVNLHIADGAVGEVMQVGAADPDTPNTYLNFSGTGSYRFRLDDAEMPEFVKFSYTHVIS